MRNADGRIMLGVALAVGLVVRAAVLWQTAGLGPEIVDEQHYVSLAKNLLAGQGFGWAPGEPTSIRPPLYPAFLAVVWAVTGFDLQIVRLIQIVLALVTTAFVYQIGRRLFGPVVGRYAAAITWLYPSLVFFNFTILTETLYVLLLAGFVLLAIELVARPRAIAAAACGLVLGLSCLTRSALWPLPIVLCPLLLLLLRGPMRTRLAMSALLFVGYALVVGPWAVRNTRIQGVVTIVDTMGGLNLHMGNYEHTPDERMWDAVSQTGEKHWAYPLLRERPAERLTEGQKDKWAQRRALAYIAAHPWVSIRRAAIKFGDFWGLERELASGFAQGMYTAPRWFEVLAPALVVLGYVAIAMAGVLGLWLTRAREWRAEVVVLLPLVGLTAIHTIVYGHSRYHIPLVPILALYAAALIRQLATRTAGASLMHIRRAHLVGAAASVFVLLVIWGRQLVFVDSERIRALFAHVR